MMRIALAASLVVVISTGAFAAPTLQNGNFDDAGPPTYPTFWTTQIPNWTVTSDESLLLAPPGNPQSAQVGVFYTFGDVSAKTGEMVLITNWPDDEVSPRTGTTDITQLISDPFRVTLDHKWIEFDYVYVTQETGLGGSATDPFSVGLIRASDSLLLDKVVVTDAYDTTLINTGGITIYPFQESGGTKNRQSPEWVHYRYDMSAFDGQDLRLVFSIEDTGNDLVNSGVFLENVEQSPEPATLIIFGLGALGLGYVVRRRRSKA